MAFRSGPGPGRLCRPRLCGASGGPPRDPGRRRLGSVPVAWAAPARCAQGPGCGLGVTPFPPPGLLPGNRAAPGPALRCGRTCPSPGSEASVALSPSSPPRSGRAAGSQCGPTSPQSQEARHRGRHGGAPEPVRGGVRLAHWPQCAPRLPRSPVHPGCCSFAGAATPGRVRSLPQAGGLHMRPPAPRTGPGARGRLCAGDVVSPGALGGLRGPCPAPHLRVRGVRGHVSAADPRPGRPRLPSPAAAPSRDRRTPAC